MRKSYFGDKAFFRRVFTIAIPIFIQNTVTNFVSLLDNLMVGQLGTLPMSGVAIVNQLLFIFNLVVFGISTGTGIFTAQFFGKGDQEGVQNTFRFKILASFLLSGLCIAAFALWDDLLIRLFLTGEGSAADAAGILAAGKEYLIIMLFGLLPFALSSSYASTLRECGETMVPMLSSFAAMFFNLILNYILIFGHLGLPAMGATGAAVATVVSRYVELAVVALWAHRNNRKFPFMKGVFRSVRIPGKLMGQMMRKVAPLILNETLWSLALTFQTQCYSTCGLLVVGALNIVSTINTMGTVITTSMGNTVGIIMGQMLGAGRPKEELRAENKRLLRFSFVAGAVFALLLASTAAFFPDFYNTTPEIRAMAAAMILLLSATKPFQCYHVSVYYTIRSGGQILQTMLFDSGFLWIVVAPITFLMCHFVHLPFPAVYGLCLLPEVLKAIFGKFLLRKDSWIKNLTAD